LNKLCLYLRGKNCILISSLLGLAISFPPAKGWYIFKYVELEN
jgi:hypothetical protein